MDLQWNRFNDPNDAYADLQLKIDNITNKYLQKRKMTKSEIKQKQKPWITPEILKMIQKRNKLHRLFLKATDQSLKENLYTKYKTIRNKLVSKIRHCKKDHYKEYFLKNSNDIKNTWRGIKTIIHLDRTKSSPTSLLKNDNLITNPTEIANEFNDYFANIASKLQASIFTQGEDFNKYLKNRANCSFFISPTNKYEILDTINRNISKRQ